MKAFTAILSSLLICGGAMAQTNPGSPTTPPQPSQSSAPSQDNTNHQNPSSSGMSMSDRRAAMNNCVAQQQQSNPGISKTEAKRACKAQMKDQ